jgi:hypothetical protein
MLAILALHIKSQYPNSNPAKAGPNKSQLSNVQIIKLNKPFFLNFGHYLDIGLPARSRFGEGRCLEFGYSSLALSLFVFGVFTDHPDDPFSFYDFTLIADFFNRCPDFHRFYLNSSIALNLTWFRVYFSRKIILPRERS